MKRYLTALAICLGLLMGYEAMGHAERQPNGHQGNCQPGAQHYDWAIAEEDVCYLDPIMTAAAFSTLWKHMKTGKSFRAAAILTCGNDEALDGRVAGTLADECWQTLYLLG